MGEYVLDFMKGTDTLILAFAAYMTARAFSECTIKRRISSLSNFARFIAPMGLAHAESADVEEWVGTLRTARTKHSYRSDLNTFYTWAVRRKLVESNPVDATDPIRVPKGLPRPVPIDAVPMIVRAATDPLRTGLALAAYAGLRCSEVVALTSDDIQFAPEPLIAVRNGKGKKDRILPMHPAIADLLLDRRPQGRLVPWRAQRFGDRAATHMRQLGFDCTAHQLRHSFGTELARNLDGNMVAMASLMGHASVNTSQLYNGWAGGETAQRVKRLYAVA